MAPLTITVRDETTAGRALAELELQLSAQRMRVRDLIRERVHQEVRAHNAAVVSDLGRFFGLVQPEDAERELNGDPRGRRPVDAERQTAVALRAFERGHVLVLVDDRQVEELDRELTLTPDTRVAFLKLVPLVGG